MDKTIKVELTEQELDMLELCVAYAAGSVFGPREIDLPMYQQLDGKIQQAKLTEGKPGYTIRVDGDGESIQCHLCGRTSNHPQDVANKYCGHCHKFHEEPQAQPH